MTMPRIGNLRAYLAGTGATGALIAGAVIAFLTVGALVAFDGSIFGGDDASGSVSLADQPGGTAPESAAAALGAGPGGVARTPAGGAVLAAVFPGAGGGAGSSGTGPGGTAPGTDGPGTPPTTPPASGGGALSGVVQDLDETTSGLGLPPLSQTTGPLTDQLDNTVNDTLNNVGGLLGNPNLGDNVSNGVRDLSDGLLGH
jgi:hypothetical protein